MNMTWVYTKNLMHLCSYNTLYAVAITFGNKYYSTAVDCKSEYYYSPIMFSAFLNRTIPGFASMLHPIRTGEQEYRNDSNGDGTDGMRDRLVAMM